MTLPRNRFVGWSVGALIATLSLLVKVGGAAESGNGPIPTYQVLKHADQPWATSRLAPPVTLWSFPTVVSLRYAADGKRVTAVDANGRVGELLIGGTRRLRLIQRLNREPACAQLSRDARLLAFADLEGTVSLNDLAAGKLRFHHEHLPDRTVALRFSADETLLAGASDTGCVRLWDVKSGKLTRTLRVPPGPVQTLAFSPDGKQLAVASFSEVVQLFDLRAVDKSPLRCAAAERVTALAYTPSSQQIVIATADGAVRLHHVSAAGEPVSIGTRTFAVWSIEFDPYNQRLALGSWDGSVELRDTQTWKFLQSRKGQNESVSALAFGPQGDLISASLDGTLKHWLPDIPSIPPAAMIAGRPDSVWTSAFSPDGTKLFVGGVNRRFELWDVADQKLLWSRPGQQTTRCATFSPDGATLATGGADGKVILWNWPAKEKRTVLQRHPGAVSAVVFTPDGKTLVSACDGQAVKLWNIDTGLEKATWNEHREQIYCASISPDGKWLLTGGGNWTSDALGELIVWELATGRVHARSDRHRLAIWAIVFMPDGSRFATSSSTGNVKIWNAKSFTEEKTLPHSMWVRGLAFSSDGRTLAVGRGDGSVRLWDTRRWQQRAALDGNTNFSFSLQFSPAGDWLATSGNDGTVRFWRSLNRPEIDSPVPSSP